MYKHESVQSSRAPAFLLVRVKVRATRRCVIQTYAWKTLKWSEYKKKQNFSVTYAESTVVVAPLFFWQTTSGASWMNCSTRFWYVRRPSFRNFSVETLNSFQGLFAGWFCFFSPFFVFSINCRLAQPHQTHQIPFSGENKKKTVDFKKV